MLPKLLTLVILVLPNGYLLNEVKLGKLTSPLRIVLCKAPSPIEVIESGNIGFKELQPLKA